MATKQGRKSKQARSFGGGRELDAYLQESQRPLVILAYLMPFVIFYEMGSVLSLGCGGIPAVP